MSPKKKISEFFIPNGKIIEDLLEQKQESIENDYIIKKYRELNYER